MALKDKAYLQNMDLPTYAEKMPKSEDPNTGFCLDIFSLQPTNVSHWIAPYPLAKYVKLSSENYNIIDATEMSLDKNIIEKIYNELGRKAVIIR